MPFAFMPFAYVLMPMHIRGRDNVFGRSSSCNITVFDEHLQLSDWHSLLVSVLSLLHGLLDDVSNLLGGLCEYLIHVLCHGVCLSQVLGC